MEKKQNPQSQQEAALLATRRPDEPNKVEKICQGMEKLGRVIKKEELSIDDLNTLATYMGQVLKNIKARIPPLNVQRACENCQLGPSKCFTVSDIAKCGPTFRNWSLKATNEGGPDINLN